MDEERIRKALERFQSKIEINANGCHVWKHGESRVTESLAEEWAGEGGR